MLEKFISFFGEGNSYKKMTTIARCYDDNIGLLIQNIDTEIQYLSEKILYAPSLMGVRDITRVNQDCVKTVTEVKTLLVPIQKAMEARILSSAIISMPEKLQNAMQNNPWQVFEKVNPATQVISSSTNNPDHIAVWFQLSGVPFIGWLKPSTLISLDCQFHKFWLPNGKQADEKVPSLNLKPDLKPVVGPPKQVKAQAYYKAGEIFHDYLKNGNPAPEMVNIPAGDFLMGDVQGTGLENELPVHRVSIENFYMSRYLVSFAEYDEFAEATGREKPDDEGWGRANRPVINVSWYEALAYTDWLSEQTGKHYTLPTEAQWEYAAKAGVDTDYPWGNDLGTNRLNCRNSGSKWSGKQTAPVGSFSPNAFGLFDMVGNVWAWTCSAYTNKYDGSEQRCVSNKYRERVVLRGGSWYNLHIWSRLTFRYRYKPSFHLNTVGFRLIIRP